MADLSSTKIYGRLTVIHDAILKANAAITGNVNVVGDITASNATFSNVVSASSVTLTGDIAADTATITNALSAGTLSASSATLTGNLGVVDVNASGNLFAVNTTLTGNLNVVDINGANITLTGNLGVVDVNASGNVNATNATLTGNLGVVGVTASGDISAVNGTLTGDLGVANVTASGNLGVANVTASGNLGVVDVNASGIVSGNGSGLTNVDAETVDGIDSSSLTRQWELPATSTTSRWIKVCTLNTPSANDRFKIDLTGVSGYGANTSTDAGGTAIYLTRTNDVTTNKLIAKAFGFTASKPALYGLYTKEIGTNVWELWIKAETYSLFYASFTGDTSKLDSTTSIQDTKPTGGFDQNIHDVWHEGRMGANSGLDADLLDGVEGSQFVRNDQNNTIVGNQTIDGKMIVDGGQNAVQVRSDGVVDHAYMSFYPRDASLNSRAGYIGFSTGSSDNFSIANEIGDIYLVSTGQAYINSNQIWHAGNDGAGSTLDADMVDGLEASQFLRSDTVARQSIPDIRNWPNAIASDPEVWNMHYVMKWDAYNNALAVIADTSNNARRWGIQSGHNSSSYGNVLGVLELNPFGGSVLINGEYPWHTGNDGPGSGLDADTLDGKQLTTIEQDAESAALALAIALG